MTLDLIETLRTSIYNPKHTKNTKIHFNFLKKFTCFKNPYFSKVSNSKQSAFYADLYGIVYILC